MSRKGKSITLSLNEEDKFHLESLASDFGFNWGDRPNISKLIEAIAVQQLIITPNHNWTKERIDALNRARMALIDAGELEKALLIAKLLLEGCELNHPLKDQLKQFIANPVIPWRIHLERYIRQQQPFHLSYEDASGRVWRFSIYCAELVIHEDRQYLDCWCEETEGNQDIAELRHNWCLRLDRIMNAQLIPLRFPAWRPQLDTTLVELHLFDSLAHAYYSKTNQDELSEWLEDKPETCRVVRRISNSFWLIREVLSYGQNCEVIFPKEIRNRVKDHLIELWNRYNI